MAIDFTALAKESRLLIEADLKPIQGTRFQPTGFPDLGAATYELSDGTPMLLLESAQSMANRLECACWNEAEKDLVGELDGLPYVVIRDGNGRYLSTSILEAHRLNSPYILESEDRSFFERLKSELGFTEKGHIDWETLARVLLKYDPNCLLHGLFLAKKELAGGRYKLPRSLSAFIEAKDVRPIACGGVKRDDVDPTGDAQKGFGHVPFHREEYTGKITAYFSLDLSQIRGYRLGPEAEKMLMALGLLKIRRLLDSGLRLRTACDLELVDGIRLVRPKGWEVPTLDDLSRELPAIISKCKGKFADPPKTEVAYIESKKSKKKDKEAADTE